MYTSSNLLASAKATFWEHFGDRAERAITSQQQQFPYNICFPVETTMHKMERVTWLQAAWQNIQNILCSPLHNNSHTRTHVRAQWKLVTLAGVKGFHTNKYLQETRDSSFNSLKNSLETFYILTATLNLQEKMFKINVLLRCSFLVQITSTFYTYNQCTCNCYHKRPAQVWLDRT